MPARASVVAALDSGSLTSDQRTLVFIVGGLAILALFAAGIFARGVLSAGTGTPRMQDIAKAVQEGAQAFLRRQFFTLSFFAVAVFGLLFLLPATGGFQVKLGRSLFFLVGAVFSALVGFIGMTLATRANLRVAAAAQKLRDQAGRQDRVPLRRRGRHVHDRPRPARRRDRHRRLQQPRA